MAARKTSKRSKKKSTRKGAGRKTATRKTATRKGAGRKGAGRKGAGRKKTARKSAGTRSTPNRAKKSGKRKAAKRAAQESAGTSQQPPSTIWAWHETMTGDVAASKAFYTSLFGWSAQDMEMPTGMYTLFMKGAEHVGGCMAIPENEGKAVCPPNWLSYLLVDDVDNTVARARTLGARVDVPGMDIPGMGRFAVLGDPTGATFAVYQRA